MNVSSGFDSNLQIIWYQLLTKNCFVHSQQPPSAKSDNFYTKHIKYNQMTTNRPKQL